MAQDKKQSPVKTLQKLLQTVLGLLLGVGCALAILPYATAHFLDDPFWLFELKSILLLLAAVPCYLLMIALHEGGHLVAGLRSGYSFVSFRVLNVMLVKLNGRLQWKRFSLAGTAGQCLLKPPAWTEQGIPVQLYNWGGVIVNAVCTALLLPVVLLTPASTFGGMLVLELLVMNAWGLLSNGIPMTGNDGDNALHLVKDRPAQFAFWQQMTANALLTEGMASKDLPDVVFELPEQPDAGNPLIAATAVNAAQRPLLLHRFDEARTAIQDALDTYSEGIPPIHRFLLQNDQVWLELMGENRQDVLDSLLTKEFRKYTHAMQNYPAVIRTQYALAVLKNDQQTADKQRALLDRVAASYPYPQDLEAERELMALTDEKIKAA